MVCTALPQLDAKQKTKPFDCDVPDKYCNALRIPSNKIIETRDLQNIEELSNISEIF
jgi:hypothetical protein